MKEAILYEKLPKKQVKCQVCNHHCVIPENKRGICQVRENQNGKLFSLVYGRVVSSGVDPIEKKPLFHFLPGTNIYSYATVGCNLRCDNCHNWQISQYPKIKNGEIMGEDTTVKHIVEEAVKNNCPSIAATYTEPTIFAEFAFDIMKLAKKEGLKNVWVSNGFMSKETLDLIIPYLDAVNIDLKFYDDDLYKKHCGARVQPILDNLQYLKNKKVWVEVTTLCVPTLSDSSIMFKQIADFISKKLGTETPWHISGFSPEISYKLQHLSPTSSEVIKNAIAIGKKAGLKYIYGGNAWGINLENTFCPNCQKLVVERNYYRTNKLFNEKGTCLKCQNKLDFIL